ncbi:MAG: FAD-binding oxidoreductase [Firmicutes bacterium]|nr:FAD-binding oxidoreductase [Bacillota bacterium]
MLEETTLSDIIQGPIIWPHHPEYDRARAVWNRHPDHRPAVIVRAQGTADVIQAVHFAQHHELPISVKSGGHHVSGVGAGPGALMIDLSAMRGIVVHPGTQTAVIQGGALAKDVIRETQVFGLALPTGNIGRVGVAALALGGGMGFLRRRYGLTCDHLLGADLVLPDGRYVHVDEKNNPDLFWAIRGGGGNFGIAVTLYVRLVPIGPQVAGVHTIYRLADAERVLKGCRTLLEACGDELTLNIDMMCFPPLEHLPPFLAGQTVVMVSGLHSGTDQGAALTQLQTLRTFAEPVMDLTGIVEYTWLHSILDHMLPPAHFGYMESLYVKDFSDALIDDAITMMTQARPGQMVMLWPLGGAMARHRPEDTAFGDRKAGVLVLWESGWETPDQAEAGIQWVRTHRQALKREAYNGGTYLNVTDLSHAATIIPQTYGANYDRLKAIKRKYDPMNRLRFNANIKPW